MKRDLATTTHEVRAGGEPRSSLNEIAPAPHSSPSGDSPGARRSLLGSPLQRFAALAVLAALLTGGTLVAVADTGWAALGGCAYLLIVVLALFAPPAIAAQVVSGQALIAGLMMGQDGAGPIRFLPAVIGVVVTAELLAAVARMDTPFSGHPRRDLHRAGWSGLLAGGVFSALTLVGRRPGPGGFGAILMGAGACVLVAALLVWKQGTPGR